MNRLTADDVLRMSFSCTDFHQSVFAVLLVQRKGLPHDQRSTAYPEKQADERVYTRHIQYHREDERCEQTTCENDQVLCFQPFKFHGSSNAFIDVVTVHKTSDYRKNERRIVAATIRKIQAPNHEAAVFDVSGSPLLNLLYTFTPPISPTTAPIASINCVAGSK